MGQSLPNKSFEPDESLMHLPWLENAKKSGENAINLYNEIRLRLLLD